MPVLGAFLLIVQVAFAVHAIQTGRDRFWVYIIIFVPAFGCLLYFLTQVLPELGSSPTVRKAGNSLLKAVDPQRELRRRKEALQISDSVDNRLALADECVEARFYDDAISLYQSCLRGVHAHDPEIMLKLAHGQFLDGRHEATRQTLEDLIRENPEFCSADGHLLYARTLEALDMTAQAAREYEILLGSYPGEESRVRYALMLKRLGDTQRAKVLFEDTLLRGRRASRHYRRRQKEWLDIARSNS